MKRNHFLLTYNKFRIVVICLLFISLFPAFAGCGRKVPAASAVSSDAETVSGSDLFDAEAAKRKEQEEKERLQKLAK